MFANEGEGFFFRTEFEGSAGFFCLAQQQGTHGFFQVNVLAAAELHQHQLGAADRRGLSGGKSLG